jgi:hypothetical protein
VVSSGDEGEGVGAGFCWEANADDTPHTTMTSVRQCRVTMAFWSIAWPQTKGTCFNVAKEGKSRSSHELGVPTERHVPSGAG